MNDAVEFHINYVGNMLISHIRANLHIRVGREPESRERP